MPHDYDSVIRGTGNVLSFVCPIVIGLIKCYSKSKLVNKIRLFVHERLKFNVIRKNVWLRLYARQTWHKQVNMRMHYISKQTFVTILYNFFSLNSIKYLKIRADTTDCAFSKTGCSFRYAKLLEAFLNR